MKKIFALSLIVAMSTALLADVTKGQKFYLKSLKAKFEMTGTKFAAEHTVSEWAELFERDAVGFKKEYGDRFPNARAILENPENKKNLENLGDFVKEFGADSGNVPSCG